MIDKKCWWLGLVIVLSVVAVPGPVLALQEAPSVLTPTASSHNTRAMQLYLAGDLTGSVAELKAAYAALPDPVVHREGRDLVLGSLRGALLELFEKTGERVHLCEARALQRAYVSALRGAGGVVEDSSQSRLAELDARVSAAFPDTGCQLATVEVQAVKTVVASGRSVPAPLRLADTRQSRRMRGAGGALIGVAGVAAIGTVIAGVVYGAKFRRLDELNRGWMDPAELAEIDGLHGEGQAARTAAIVLGSGGGVLLFAGVALLVSSRRAQRMSVTPTLTRGLWGVQVRASF